jgi:hypothetical protein
MMGFVGKGAVVQIGNNCPLNECGMMHFWELTVDLPSASMGKRRKMREYIPL